MKYSDLTIGVKGTTLESLATLIYETFGYSFVPRSSTFLGGDYYMSEVGVEEVIVHLNRDGDEVAEEEFSEFYVLLQINSCRDPERWIAFADNLEAELIRKNAYELGSDQSGSG